MYIVLFGKAWSNVTYGLEYGYCDGPEKLYNKVIIDWIYSRPDLFDTTKIFIEGFSKNGASAGTVVIIILIFIVYYDFLLQASRLD